MMGLSTGTNVDPRFVVPEVSGQIVIRATAIDRLTASKGRVAMVSGPAGYGKTSHVATWVRTDGRPVAWIELVRADNDPRVLFEHLIDQLVHVTEFDRSRLPTGAISLAQFETLTTPAFAQLATRDIGPFIVVLDDLHLIDDDAALDLVGVLGQSLSDSATLVLVGRNSLPARLASLHVHPGVITVDTVDLAHDKSSARTMLDLADRVLSDDELDELLAETEGWPVGMLLANLAPDASHEPHDGALTHGIRDRVLTAYMQEEWLRGLGQDDVDFLRKVSGLDWLSGELCDYALDRTDSGATLERLALSNLVVIPLDRRGDSYRMHQLLADVLDTDAERIDREERRTIARRAGEWFEQIGDIDRAVRSVLRVGDVERAIALIGRHAAEYQMQGRHHVVDQWLAAIPRSSAIADSEVCLISAVNTISSGDLEGGAIWLRLSEHASDDSDQRGSDRKHQLKLSVLRVMLSTIEPSEALADAERAYRELEPGRWHAYACFARGLLIAALGDSETAVATLAEGAAEARLLASPMLEAQCLGTHAFVLGLQGNWSGARPLASAARRILREHHLEHLPTLVMVTATSAWSAAVEGDPARAQADIMLTRRNLSYFTKTAIVVNLQTRIALGHASLLLDDRAAARVVLDEAMALWENLPNAMWIRQQIDDLNMQIRSSRKALSNGPSSLSTAELRVLHYLPTNLTLTEIGRRLFVSRNTAKTHAAAVYRKLGASSRGEAVEIARSAGLLWDESAPRFEP